MYQLCVLSTLLYSSKMWIEYTQKESQLFSPPLPKNNPESPDRVTYQTRMSLPKPASQICLHYCLGDTCTGLDTSSKWKMVTSQKSYYTEYSSLAIDMIDDLLCTTRMYVRHPPKAWEAMVADHKDGCMALRQASERASRSGMRWGRRKRA